MRLSGGNALVRQKPTKFRSFHDARAFAHTLNLKSSVAWVEFCTHGERPSDIPSNPQVTYSLDWEGWRSWLGTGEARNVRSTRYKFRAFDEARRFARKIGLKGRTESRRYCASPERPLDIPTNPQLHGPPGSGSRLTLGRNWRKVVRSVFTRWSSTPMANRKSKIEATTRPATDADFVFAWKLYSETIEPIITPYIRKVRQMGWSPAAEKKRFRGIWDPKKVMIITVRDGPIGWISVDASEISIRIENIFIAEEYRNHGLGTHLLEWLLKQNRGRPFVVTIIEKSKSQKFFERLKFKKVAKLGFEVHLAKAA